MRSPAARPRLSPLVAISGPRSLGVSVPRFDDSAGIGRGAAGDRERGAVKLAQRLGRLTVLAGEVMTGWFRADPAWAG